MECSPRRIYTGTIGFIEPGGRSQFNVAIRTVLVNRATGEAEYGIGGGIVADSNRDDEWNESQIKVATADRTTTVVRSARDPAVDAGRRLLAARPTHEAAASVGRLFRVSGDVLDMRERLERYAAGLPRTPHRVRLVVSRRGAVEISSAPHDVDAGFLDRRARGGADRFRRTRFSITRPRIARSYEDAIAARPGFEDVLLYNERGEVTESTIANLVVEIGGELLTPPVSSGLLPGTLRAHLLDEGRIREKVITLQDVRATKSCYLVELRSGISSG